MLFYSQPIYYQSSSSFSNSYFLISTKSSNRGEANQNQIFAPPPKMQLHFSITENFLTFFYKSCYEEIQI